MTTEGIKYDDRWDKLKEPFPTEDIEWRLQTSGEKNGKVWAICLAYVTNRAIMQRLDDVVGPENWCNQYEEGPHGGVICGISIRIKYEDNGLYKWVTKWDGADNTQVEQVKGGLSGAMKRAAVQWGIGRYLYNLPATYAIVSDKGEHNGKFEDKKTKEVEWFKWSPPALPDWALPSERKRKATAKEGEFLDGFFELFKIAQTQEELKQAWNDAIKTNPSEQDLANLIKAKNKRKTELTKED